MMVRKVTGVDLDLKVDPATLSAAVRRAAVAGLRHAAEETRTYAVNITPKDRGHLRESAEVSVDAGNLEAAISYNTPYAVYVHERTELNHKVGQAKFLETAIAVKQEDMQRILAKYLEGVLGK